jgi:hypothetical protein
MKYRLLADFCGPQDLFSDSANIKEARAFTLTP